MRSVWWLGLASAHCIVGHGDLFPRIHLKGEVIYDGYEYRTLMPHIPVDGLVPKCHQPGLWLPLPGNGWELVPDNVEMRHNVVSMHSWSSHIVVLASMKGITTRMMSARRTGYHPGWEYGDGQPKAQMRFRNGIQELTVDWTCYQILIRRKLQASGGTDSHLPPANNRKGLADLLEEHPDLVDKFGNAALDLLGRLGRPAHKNDFKHPPAPPPKEEDDDGDDEERDEEDFHWMKGDDEEDDDGPSLAWKIAIGSLLFAVATVCLSLGVCLGFRVASRSSALPTQPLLQASGREMLPAPAAAATMDTGLTSYQEV